MRDYLRYVAFIFIALLAVVPLIDLAAGGVIAPLTGSAVSALNFLGWSIVLALLVWREELRKHIVATARKLDVYRSTLPMDELLSLSLRELNRKNESLSTHLMERRISSEEESSQALERIVSSAIRLLDGESAELALFDRESSLYHSSFVVGKPFRTSAQAMLSGALEGEEAEISPDVLVQPISFAGSVLGSLRVALKRDRLPTSGDRQILQLLAMQSGLAIINAQYTNQLLRMKLASEESIKAKTGFLANLSHELRGPLGIMLNAVELVLDGLCGPVSEEQTETLQMVKGNGSHLLELINDVLDYAKSESGKLSPQPVEILADEILKDLVGVVRKQAEAKSHKLAFRGNSDALAVLCDRRHLRQMMINVLTNAIKYTPTGGEIQVWAERMPGGKIRLNVKDSGIGIDLADRDKVFSAFQRIENSYSVTQVGTGLGMSLTKKLCEANGGSIDFSSQSGEGSHFWINLPSAAASQALANRDSADNEEPARGKNDLILLVQKRDGESKMLSRYLTHIGFAVVPVQSKIEAVQAIRDRSVKVVLIDNNIIDRPGDDVVAAIRDAAKESSLPVVLITSRAFIFDIEKYLKAGIDRCLVKPIELGALGHICRQLIDGCYTGVVLDPAEVDIGRTPEQKPRQPLSRVIKTDDILH